MNTTFKFTDAQIETLRNGYAKIERVDPLGQSYEKLTSFLDGLSKENLQILVDAKIKWVSMLAKNRIK